jgi:hypothetical protein
MLMETIDPFEFTPPSHEATGITYTSHMDAPLAPTQPHFASAQATGAPITLAGSDSLAFLRLQWIFQQHEARARQTTLDYECLKCVYYHICRI